MLRGLSPGPMGARDRLRMFRIIALPKLTNTQPQSVVFLIVFTKRAFRLATVFNFLIDG